MKVFLEIARGFREVYINVTIFPFFLLTLYVQVASQLHWDLFWLRTNEPVFCLLGWIAGVFLTWHMSERAWEHYLQQANWKRWRTSAFVVGGCSLVIALTALVAQIEKVYAPNVYIILSFIFMIVNAYVLHASLDPDKKRKQPNEEPQPTLTQQIEDENASEA